MVNLSELCEELTVQKMRENMILAAKEVYGLEPFEMPQIECEEKEKIAKFYSSWDYIYGITIPCDFACEGRFSWGGIQLKFVVKNGVIEALQVFSDSMNFCISETLETALKGAKFDREVITEILLKTLDTEIAQDISRLIADEVF